MHNKRGYELCHKVTPLILINAILQIEHQDKKNSQASEAVLKIQCLKYKSIYMH